MFYLAGEYAVVQYASLIQHVSVCVCVRRCIVGCKMREVIIASNGFVGSGEFYGEFATCCSLCGELKILKCHGGKR